MSMRYTTDIPIETLPKSWQKHILLLRRESMRVRIERNQARGALAVAIAERDAAKELADSYREAFLAAASTRPQADARPDGLLSVEQSLDALRESAGL